MPALENCPLHNEDGTSAFHLYAPWWPYKEQLAGKLGFARGYYIGLGRRTHDARRERADSVERELRPAMKEEDARATSARS